MRGGRERERESVVVQPGFILSGGPRWRLFPCQLRLLPPPSDAADKQQGLTQSWYHISLSSGDALSNNEQNPNSERAVSVEIDLKTGHWTLDGAQLENVCFNKVE